MVCACELMNDPALAPPGRTTPRRVTPWLAVVKHWRAQLGRGTERKRVGLFPFPGERVRVRGCTGAWICVRVRACACRGHDHGDDQDNGGDTTTGKMNGGTRKKGRLAGLRARRRRQRHLQEMISQSGSMTGITQRVRGSAVTFRDTVAST
jgi:hypothetical protein